MHKSWTLGIVPLLAGALILITGCSSDSTAPTQSSAGIHVSISPSALTRVNVGTTQAFAATLTNDAKNAGVTWTVSGAGCAGTACGTLAVDSSADSAAQYSAPGTVPTPATVTVTATSISDPTRSASKVFSITLPVQVSITPTDLAGVDERTTRQFTATVGNDPDNLGVIWSASGNGCSGVTCGTFSATRTASGVAVTYMAPASAPTPGIVTVQAISASDPKGSASAAVVVTAPGVVTVVVFPLSGRQCTTAPRGGYTTYRMCALQGRPVVLTASVFNDPGSAGVTWSWSGGHGTVSPTSSASGVGVTFRATTGSVGSESVTASSVADPTKSASATVSLWHP